MLDCTPSDVPLPAGWPLCVRSAVLPAYRSHGHPRTQSSSWLVSGSDNPPTDPDEQAAQYDRVVTAKYADHVHHVDLTVVPSSLGMWAAWMPFALPQSWPFAWWVAVAIDHFSRRAMGATVFNRQPTSIQVRTFLGRLYARVTPKHIISDKGSQFWCDGFKVWCKRRNIRPQFGAVGQYGNIAVLERFLCQSLRRSCGLSAANLGELNRSLASKHSRIGPEKSVVRHTNQAARSHVRNEPVRPVAIQRHTAHRTPVNEPAREASGTSA